MFCLEPITILSESLFKSPSYKLSNKNTHSVTCFFFSAGNIVTLGHSFEGNKIGAFVGNSLDEKIFLPESLALNTSGRLMSLKLQLVEKSAFAVQLWRPSPGGADYQLVHSWDVSYHDRPWVSITCKHL